MVWLVQTTVLQQAERGGGAESHSTILWHRVVQLWQKPWMRDGRAEIHQQGEVCRFQLPAEKRMTHIHSVPSSSPQEWHQFHQLRLSKVLSAAAIFDGVCHKGIAAEIIVPWFTTMRCQLNHKRGRRICQLDLPGRDTVSAVAIGVTTDWWPNHHHLHPVFFTWMVTNRWYLKSCVHMSIKTKNSQRIDYQNKSTSLKPMLVNLSWWLA